MRALGRQPSHLCSQGPLPILEGEAPGHKFYGFVDDLIRFGKLKVLQHLGRVRDLQEFPLGKVMLQQDCTQPRIRGPHQRQQFLVQLFLPGIFPRTRQDLLEDKLRLANWCDVMCRFWITS